MLRASEAVSRGVWLKDSGKFGKSGCGGSKPLIPNTATLLTSSAKIEPSRAHRLVGQFVEIHARYDAIAKCLILVSPAVPLGYDAVDRKLKIYTEEAKTVRWLYETYLELGRGLINAQP